MNTPRYSRLLLFIKAALFVFMLVVIYRKLTGVQHFIGSFDDFKSRFSGGNMLLIFIVALLMPLNWLIEAIKWQLLLRRSVAIGIGDALRSVLGGLSIGFATPARVGEFAGRVMFLHEGERIDGIYLSALGGLAQSIVTFLTALFMLRFYTGDAALFFSPISYIAFALLVLVMLFVYIQFEEVVAWLGKTRLPIRHYVIDSSKTPSRNDKWFVFLTSALRYGVYLLQYYLLLRFIGIDAPVYELIAAVSLILFLQSVSPLIPLTDITIRGGIALIVFDRYSHTMMSMGIFMVPVMLWFINLLIPALLGYIYILNLRADDASK